MSNVVMTILCTYHDQSPNLDLIWLNAINEAASVAKKARSFCLFICENLLLPHYSECRSLAAVLLRKEAPHGSSARPAFGVSGSAAADG